MVKSTMSLDDAVLAIGWTRRYGVLSSGCALFRDLLREPVGQF